MNTTIKQCDNDLLALDAAEKLNDAVKSELEQFESVDTSELLGKAAKLIMTGNLTLEGLGISPKLFEHIKQLDALNSVARDKLRSRIKLEKNQLEQGGVS